jgi:pimeloyl-ACP methyl ester carboxylesterase
LAVRAGSLGAADRERFVLKKFLILLVIGVAVGAGYYYWSSRMSEDAAVSHLTADDRMMEIAGANVRVRIEGPDDAPPIILMHGFIYSLETWDAWAAALKSDHRVIRFDLLGHGLSGPDPQQRYSPEERAAFVGDVMDALGVDRAIIGGNSLGGLAAWRFAAMAPDRVAALIMVSPGGYPANGVGDTPLSPPAPMALFLRTAPEAGVAISLGNIYGDDSKITPEKIKLVGDMMREPGNGEAYVQSIEEFTLPDPEPALRTITAPTLILWGAADIIIPPDNGRKMAGAIPNSKLVYYEGVGHVAQEEASEETIADVKAFLTEVEGRH